MKAKAKFYAVFARDGRGAPRARLVKAGAKPLTVKPGECMVALQLEIDERAFETLLTSPTIEVNADDVAKPKLVVLKDG